MNWNASLISGPWPVSNGLVFVLPAREVTLALQLYAVAAPTGVPVLSGTASQALTFADVKSAKAALAAFWIADV